MTTEMITTNHHNNHPLDAVPPVPAVLVIDDDASNSAPISLLPPSLVIDDGEMAEADGSDPATDASRHQTTTRTNRYERASNTTNNNNNNNTPQGNFSLYYPHPGSPFHQNPGPKPPSSPGSSTAALLSPSPSSSTPNSPILSPIIQDSTPNGSTSTTNPLSSLNTSALVRTISNGSTFGPIPNWPLCVSNQSSSSNGHHHHHHHHHQHHHSANVHENGDNHHHHANVPIRHSHDPTKSPSVNGVGQINVINPSTTSPSSHGSSATTTTTSSSSSSSSSSSYSSSYSSKYATSQPNSVPIMATAAKIHDVELKLPLIFGENYVLISPIEASNLFRCLEMNTNQEFRCKVVLSKSYYDFLSPHFRMDGHDGINQIQKIIIGRVHTFVLFPSSYGDLHSYVRNERRLTETEAMPLFKQIVKIVADCHNNGIILRDLKLRKFVFSDEKRTQLKLETLEGASMFDDDDTLWDKHGCPAYVSPEIIFSNSFSGLAADCWGMGVILYTMLVGRYPFHDVNPSSVFCKIRRGTYSIPERLSRHAQCLIRSLMRIDPNERLTAEDALAHRWFQEKSTTLTSSSSLSSSSSSTMLQQSPISSLPTTLNSIRSLISNSINSSIIRRRSHHHHLNNNPPPPPPQQQQQSSPQHYHPQQPTSMVDSGLTPSSAGGVGGPGWFYLRASSSLNNINPFSSCPNNPSSNDDGSGLSDQVVPDLNINN